MIRALAIRSFREWTPAVVAATLLMAAASGAAVAYYPVWEQNTSVARSLVSYVPPGMEWVRDKVLATAFGGMEGWLAVHHHYKGLSLLGCIWAVLFGGCVLAREFETGTASLLFSRPAPRWVVAGWLYAAGACAAVLPAFLSTLAVVPMADRIGHTVAVVPLLRGASLAASLLVLVYSYSFLFSALFDAQMRAVFWAGGVTMAMILLAVLTQAKRASLFYYFDPVVYGRLLQGGEFPWPLALACLGGSAVLALSALWIVSRRDC